MDLLPLELRQEIITISASSSYRQAASLTRVSHLFNHWAKPILYRVCTFYDDDASRWPAPYPLTISWFEEHGKHIRHLQWGIHFSNNDPDRCNLITILEACPRLQGLALWVDITHNDIPSLRPVLSTLHLHRLSINVFVLFSNPHFLGIHAREPMFRFVTHLEIFWADVKEWEALSGLAQLPSLTHLALSGELGHDTVTEVTRSCQQLKVVIIMVSVFGSLPGPGGTDEDCSILLSTSVIWGDTRVVSLDCQFIQDWEIGARGGDDMWIKAEEFIENRLKTEGKMTL